MTTYSESWCEWYTTATVEALRDALRGMQGDVDHGLDYPDQYPHGTADQIPTISHEIMDSQPETRVAVFVWTPRDGWGYYLDQDIPVAGPPRPMSLVVDEPPSVFAAEARRVCESHAVSPVEGNRS